MQSKITQLSKLADIIKGHKEQKKRVVLCHGVFDLLHIGHIRYFEQARKMGDILVVTLTPDQYVDKGSHRPTFTETLRAEAVASLDCVNFVAINEWPTAEETLRLLRPHLYVKGAEFKKSANDPTGKIDLEKKVVREIGATLAFTDDIVFSSTNLINRYLSSFPGEVNEYLELFRQRHSLSDIVQLIESFSALKVLVIGDTILDEYQYCDAIGKSSKDPTLVLKYQNRDLFAGGVLAVANHVANFADSVDLASIIGQHNSHEDFIRSQLHDKITPHFTVRPKAPTLIKKRYIDGYSLNKLFEVYVMDESPLPKEKHQALCTWLRDNLAKYDLVIAADFGHGTISPEMIKILAESAPFLAVNTQANAGNRGFHTISKYPRADYASIARHELALETRKMQGTLRPQMIGLRNQLNCTQFVVTLGREGCAVCSAAGDFTKVPTFAQKIVDRVGAGDAFFAITALASKLKANNETLGFLGNVVGSLAVEYLGNKKSIDKQSVTKHVTSLLK